VSTSMKKQSVLAAVLIVVIVVAVAVTIKMSIKPKPPSADADGAASTGFRPVAAGKQAAPVPTSARPPDDGQPVGVRKR
jgi:predicted metal-binding membrane protein